MAISGHLPMTSLLVAKKSARGIPVLWHFAGGYQGSEQKHGQSYANKDDLKRR
jgi:hypothetical protein